MRLLPNGSVVLVRVATPLLTGDVPNVVEPLVNVTVPVALLGSNVSVRVTELPGREGLTDEVNADVEFALDTFCGTVPTAEL
jgi:hypothetical protein